MMMIVIITFKGTLIKLNFKSDKRKEINLMRMVKLLLFVHKVELDKHWKLLIKFK